MVIALNADLPNWNKVLMTCNVNPPSRQNGILLRMEN